MNNINFINKFLDYIEKERKFSKHTTRSYRYDLVEFNSFLMEYDSKLDFTNIDRTAIQFFIQKLSKNGASDKTLQRKVSSIKSLYRFLTEFSYIKKTLPYL